MNIWRQFWKFVQHIIRHIIHVPLEVLTFLSFFEGQLLGYVAMIEQSSQWFPSIKEFLVFLVEPCFYNSFIIL